MSAFAPPLANDESRGSHTHSCSQPPSVPDMSCAPSRSQGQKPDHIFCQGFWLALRLDLLQWFMPLPTASEATPENGASAPLIGEGVEQTAEEITTSRAAFTTPGIPPTTESIAAPRVTEPEHASILDIITLVDVSADVWGLALATWRGAENRDGFVLDMERLVESGSLLASVLCGPLSLKRASINDTRASDATQRRLKALRGCVLHVCVWTHTLAPASLFLN